MIEQILSASPSNFFDTIVELISPILHVFGFWIFLFIFGLFLFALWLRTGDVTMPLILGLLSMGTFGILFPKEALPFIILILVVCGAVILVKVLKDVV
jgi:hypothetical protein